MLIKVTTQTFARLLSLSADRLKGEAPHPGFPAKIDAGTEINYNRMLVLWDEWVLISFPTATKHRTTHADYVLSRWPRYNRRNPGTSPHDIKTAKRLFLKAWDWHLSPSSIRWTRTLQTHLFRYWRTQLSFSFSFLAQCGRRCPKDARSISDRGWIVENHYRVAKVAEMHRLTRPEDSLQEGFMIAKGGT